MDSDNSQNEQSIKEQGEQNIKEQSIKEQNIEEQGINEQSIKEQSINEQSINEQSIKEQRIRKIALTYYSRKDVLDAIYKFSQNREISPRYFEGFGKRPDSFQYPSDIIEFVKLGATSFHCSEELWNDPLQLSTELSQEQLNELRSGWDLIIDIDCPWIDISKKAAQAIIGSLKLHKIENINVKFSGSKGFHIIIPWNSFPEEIDGIKTKNMFPEWPRAIIGYLKEISRPRLAELAKDIDFTESKNLMGIECKECYNTATESYQITLRCEKCKSPYIETFTLTSENYKEKRCPHCGPALKEVNKELFYVCNTCHTNSLKNPDNFSKVPSKNLFKALGLDFLLVSPRHLFRMPYSLHEKTSLASIVLDKNKIAQFDIKDADPLNVKIIEYLPNPKKDEAKQLLLQAIDWQKSQDLKQEAYKAKYSDGFQAQKGKKEFEKITLTDLREEYFPPVILKILMGMEDGKKRALFILLNFFRSLGQSMEDVEKRINEWNKLNKPPLKKGYIDAQLIWHSRNKIVLPPNFDNPIYKEIGVYDSDELSQRTKNPVSYVIKKSGIWKNAQNNLQSKEKPKRARRKTKDVEIK